MNSNDVMSADSSLCCSAEVGIRLSPNTTPSIGELYEKEKRNSLTGSKTCQTTDFASPAEVGQHSKKSPQIKKTFEKIIEPHTGGLPTGKRKWTRLSTRRIAARIGNVSHQTVATWLRHRKFSLRSNVKRLSGPPHPDRDRQFKLIRKARTRFLNAGCPVLSVDAKNPELIGEYKNSGRKWESPDKPELVKTHDFKTKTTVKAIPYGIYDIGRNEGHVEVGTSRNTGRFVVDAIRSWWHRKGKKRYTNTRRLAIECDGGGSNGHRPWLWKRQLQRLSDDTGLIITVHHYPPGASKWNPVEHRLLGVIARNWEAIPLRNKETLLALLRGTETATGLRVTAHWNDRVYKTGEKVSEEEKKALNFKRHDAMPLWNYTFYPKK